MFSLNKEQVCVFVCICKIGILSYFSSLDQSILILNLFRKLLSSAVISLTSCKPEGGVWILNVYLIKRF